MEVSEEASSAAGPTDTAAPAVASPVGVVRPRMALMQKDPDISSALERKGSDGRKRKQAQ